MPSARLRLRACERPVSGVRLYVETMDATLVDVSEDGRVLFESEEWSTPTLQERRAIIHAASEQIAALSELIERLEGGTLG
jgi:hypothetical protein